MKVFFDGLSLASIKPDKSTLIQRSATYGRLPVCCLFAIPKWNEDTERFQSSNWPEVWWCVFGDY